MLATLSEETFRHILNTFGPRGYDYWQALIGRAPMIIPDPFNQDQRVELVTIWDDKPNQTIRVFVFPMREMGLRDLIGQFKPSRERSRDFFVFKDGKTDPPSASS